MAPQDSDKDEAHRSHPTDSAQDDTSETELSECETIYKSVRNNNRACVGFLLANNHDINATIPSGDSPLNKAVGDENEQMVRFLISRGADIEHPDTKGNRLDVKYRCENCDIVT